MGSSRPRARDLGIAIGYLPPGPRNAITDVPGVRVGHVSLIRGAGELVMGEGPVRTGVTAILPHGGNIYREPVRAGVDVINGFGKSVGLLQVLELGELESPILLTGTLNVWRVADALLEFMLTLNPGLATFNAVVGECNDAYLNDIRGRHVRAEDVHRALEGAGPEDTREGCVGAGVGMRAFGWKGGVGTSSRRLEGGQMLGVMVLTNTGRPESLRVDGLPFGRLVGSGGSGGESAERGSIMIVVATDLPLASRQLNRLARRASFGLARTGAEATHGSGDFVLAFSASGTCGREGKRGFPEGSLNQPFRAVIDATEEAVLNSLLGAETMEGRDGHRVEALPVDRLSELLAEWRALGR